MSKKQFEGLLLIIVAIFIHLQSGGGIIPGPTPDPSPIETAKKMALIVYESADVSKYPPEQQVIFNSGRIAEYFDAHTDKDENGHPMFRKWDKDVDLTYVEEVWKQGMQVSRESEPWIIITNGTTGFSGALPPNVDATLELAKEYLE